MNGGIQYNGPEFENSLSEIQNAVNHIHECQDTLTSIDSEMQQIWSGENAGIAHGLLSKDIMNALQEMERIQREMHSSLSAKNEGFSGGARIA